MRFFISPPALAYTLSRSRKLNNPLGAIQTQHGFDRSVDSQQTTSQRVIALRQFSDYGHTTKSFCEVLTLRV